ncbi:alpha/beta hydrolase [Phenylobacterium sp.]|uniref:alpha/beta hydrolase n=1 Tax=Phenylobacterium sp. TaxID=1871053 RepID=UPI002FCB6C99
MNAGTNRNAAGWAWLALALAFAASQAEAAAPTAGRRAGEIVVETRSLATPEGETLPYEIGTLFVPENRLAPGSRLIGVGFARLRAEKPTGAPPMFALPGGPGDSYLGAFTDGEGRERRLRAQLLKYRAAGDVVVIDQRGFSERGEVLTFPYPFTDLPLDRPASASADNAAIVATAKAVVAAHGDKDLSGYTVVQCVEDVNDLRRALGYDKITLLGQSFGSQWSFGVMRLHPEIVARALLSGVEPLNNGYDMPAQVFAALQRIAWEAEQDPALKPYLPAGGLVGAVQAVRERLAKAPVSVPLKDEKTGQVRTVVLGLGDFQQSLVTPADAWPAFVLSLYYGHYDDWARSVAAQRKAGGAGQAALIGVLIDSSLGVSADREHQLRSDPAMGLLGAWGFDPYIVSAPAWPTPDVGDDLRKPVATDTPVLFVHGDWDTSTPVENMLGMLPYFPAGRAIVVRRGGHGARAALLEQQPRMMALVLDFLRTGETRNLPPTAELPAPKFRAPAFPAPAKRPS